MDRQYGGVVKSSLHNQGGAGGAGASIFTPGKRRRINIVAICFNVFCPPLMFSFVLATMSFSVHYQHASLVWSIVFLSFLVAGLTALIAFRHRKRDRDPMWYMYAAISLCLSIIAATVLGEVNYWYNMQPFYDIKNLNTYASVNTADRAGQELMDAGRISFADGTRLDMHKSMSFQNGDLYCVAPIVNGNSQLAMYDFWAVGINCCSGVSSDFRCGQFNNPQARSGLRMMNAEQRPFFRLAVQQAEAAYKLNAPHPVFFYWLADPLADLDHYRDVGLKWFLLGVFTHFALNLFAVICAVVAFSKLGRLT